MSKQREWNLFERTGESAHDAQWELVRDEKGVCLAIPDHPALPAVSRWLAENGGDALMTFAHHWLNSGDDGRFPQTDGAARSLIAALTEGQG